MKKILTVCIAIIATLGFTSSATAQTKIGFFDDQQILSLMPGIGKVDTILQKYATDSLLPERDELMDDLKRVDSLLKDSTKLTGSLKKVLQEQAQGYMYKLQNWQQYQEQILRQKQEQLLAPFKKPVYEALKQVIDEQKYTVVLKPEAAVYADKSDELPLRVIAKLNIPNLPKEIEEQVRPYRSGANSPAPAKPKGK
jgi:Skp family chaperone for outer membrane proteins